jgi:mannose-6-phosphate isomerase-like protein (cupin superfamily)
MRQVWFAMMLASAIASPAGVEGFAHWPSSELKAAGSRLATKLNPQKLALETLADYGNHSVMVAHREGSGEAELHEDFNDISVVQSGSGMLVVGGRIVNGRTTGPGEIRGPSIEGGEKRQLAPGDIVHVPPRTPHQVLLEPGQKLTYVVIKIRR